MDSKTKLVNKDPFKRVNFNMPIEQHRKLRMYCAAKRVTMRSLLLEHVKTLVSSPMAESVKQNND